MVNFTDLIHRKEPIRYAMDVLKQGQIGGYCKLHNERLKEELQHVSALQSWAPELRFFEAMNKRPIDSELCDIVIDKPTYFMKIDASKYRNNHKFTRILLLFDLLFQLLICTIISVIFLIYMHLNM